MSSMGDKSRVALSIMAYYRKGGYKVATWMVHGLEPDEYEIIGDFEGVWIVGKNLKIREDIREWLERYVRKEAAERFNCNIEGINVFYLPTFGVGGHSQIYFRGAKYKLQRLSRAVQKEIDRFGLKR